MAKLRLFAELLSFMKGFLRLAQETAPGSLKLAFDGEFFLYCVLNIEGPRYTFTIL